jgi:dephospho-CoA kinase
MRVFGLTGGIGAGKSEAARMFAALGIPVIDADRIGQDATAPGGVAERAVIEAFGESILAGGRVDRKKLAALVFADRNQLQRLNNLVHPAVRAEIARQVGALVEAGQPLAIVEAALHGEDGTLPPMLTGLILIECPVELRVQRLVQLRGMSEAEARARIAAQTPPEKKAALAKWIIRNDADLASLQRQVVRVAAALNAA